MGVSTWGLVEAQHEPDTGTAPQKIPGEMQILQEGEQLEAEL